MASWRIGTRNELLDLRAAATQPKKINQNRGRYHVVCQACSNLPDDHRFGRAIHVGRAGEDHQLHHTAGVFPTLD